MVTPSHPIPSHASTQAQRKLLTERGGRALFNRVLNGGDREEGYPAQAVLIPKGEPGRRSAAKRWGVSLTEKALSAVDGSAAARIESGRLVRDAMAEIMGPPRSPVEVRPQER